MAVKTFTTGEVLTAADTNTYLANSGLVFVKSQTVGTTVSSVTVSNAFSATYKNYRIRFLGGSHTTSAAMRLQIGNATTLYYQAGAAVQIGVNNFIGIGASNVNAYFSNAGRKSADGAFMDIELINPFEAARTGFSQNTGDFLTTGFWISQGGFLNDSTSYSSFTITSDGGTFTGGTIYVYGYREG